MKTIRPNNLRVPNTYIIIINIIKFSIFQHGNLILVNLLKKEKKHNTF